MRLLFVCALLCALLIYHSDATAADSGEAEQEFAKLTAEAKALLKSGSPKPEQLRGLLVKLDRFATIYPDSPQAPNALFRRAMLGADLLSVEERIKAFKTIVEKYPKSVCCEGSCFCLGQMYLNIGKTSEARKAFGELLRLFPKTRMRNTVLRRMKQIDLLGTRPAPVEMRDLDGKLVKVPSDGNLTIIAFWSASCRRSIEQQKQMASIKADFRLLRIRVLSVCVGGGPVQADLFRDIKPLDRPTILVAMGWDSKLAKNFRVVTVPTTFILDRHGVIRHIGAARDGLDKALKKMAAAGNGKSIAKDK